MHSTKMPMCMNVVNVNCMLTCLISGYKQARYVHDNLERESLSANKQRGGQLGTNTTLCAHRGLYICPDAAQFSWPDKPNFPERLAKWVLKQGIESVCNHLHFVLHYLQVRPASFALYVNYSLTIKLLHWHEEKWLYPCKNVRWSQKDMIVER
jgi:hypothetical protein